MPQEVPKTPQGQWAPLSSQEWKTFTPQLKAALRRFVEILDETERVKHLPRKFEEPINQRRAS